jgi:hypothetical protein
MKPNIKDKLLDELLANYNQPAFGKYLSQPP